MKKAVIVFFLSSLGFMIQAMQSNIERLLENSLFKLDVMLTRMQRTVSYEDFMAIQALKAEKSVDYYSGILSKEHTAEFEDEIRLAQELTAVAHITKPILFTNDYYELRNSDEHELEKENNYGEDNSIWDDN